MRKDLRDLELSRGILSMLNKWNSQGQHVDELSMRIVTYTALVTNILQDQQNYHQ